MCKMLPHPWSDTGCGCAWGAEGTVKTVATGKATLSYFFQKMKLLILLAQYVPRFLLSMAVEGGLNY